jgi:hypothetical protein
MLMLTRSLSCLLALSAFLPGACAQTVTGSITGTVQDPGGLSIPSAVVVLSQAATGAEFRAETTERGDFNFRNLQPAEYTIAITAPGFKRFERRSLALSASETLSIGVTTLEVGAATETVTVTAQGATVQTASSERGGVITAGQVESIPVRGRNAWDLLALLPGVVPAAATNESIVRNTRFNVNGGRINSLSTVLDGMGLNQLGNFANGLLNVSMDAVAEVKMLMSNYQAEYGRTSGGEVQLIMKSGTRDFHGMVSYFKRHEQFNANGFFENRNGLAKGRYRFNTWSYNIGGPIYIPKKFNSDRNKLFFFWSQEFWPTQTTGTGRLTVPTELERAGDFSQTVDVNNARIAITDPTARTPMAGNVVPASRIDPSGQALLKIFPLPNFSDRRISGGNYNYVFSAETSKPQRFGTMRIDYNLSSRHQLSSTYSFYLDRQSGWQVATTSANWMQFQRTFWTNPKLLVVRYNFIASPTLVNELTFGANGRREAEDIPDDVLARNQRDKIGFKAGQLRPSTNPLGLVPNATFGGVPSAANLTLDQRTPDWTSRLSVPLTDNVTKTLGGHIVKAGIIAERMYSTVNAATPFNGTFAFARDTNNPLDSNYAYGNAIFGVYSTYTEMLGRNIHSEWNTYIEWYAQDTWKVSRRLTLDYGLRFSHLGGTVVPGGMVSAFDPGSYDPAKMVKLIQPAMVGGRRVGVHPVTGATYPAAAIGAIAPNTGDPANGMVIPAYNPSYPESFIENPAVLVAPRFGFAWDPFGTGKTAIRGGGGMFYQRRDVAAVEPSPQVPLITTPILYYGTLPTLTSSTGYTFPATVVGQDRYAKTPYSINLSLSVQRKIGFGTVVDVAYVGVLGRHLNWFRDLNAIALGTNFNPKNADPTNPATPLPASFLRPKVGYGNINMSEWNATSTYHSMQAQANRRFARGVQFGASWTWSKAMGYADTDGGVVTAVVSPRVWNYGLAGFDRTHVFKLNYLWEVPAPRWSNPALKHALRGWQLSGITSFVSGAPLGVGYSFVAARDTTGTPDLGARIVVTGNPVLPKSERTFSRNFRTEVFAPPAVGTIGNAAKTVIRGPGVNNFDLTILKNFPIRERFQLQFRCEMYNAFNHTQFSGLDTSARFDAQARQVNATFGQFTAAGAPRYIQFALRARF